MIMGLKTPELRRVAQYCCPYNVDQNFTAYIIKYLSSLSVNVTVLLLKDPQAQAEFQQECSTLDTRCFSAEAHKIEQFSRR